MESVTLLKPIILWMFFSANEPVGVMYPHASLTKCHEEGIEWERRAKTRRRDNTPWPVHYVCAEYSSHEQAKAVIEEAEARTKIERIER